MTIAFGHGISVTPLHLATGVAAMVNGGILYPPSFVKRNAASDPGRRVIQAKTSVLMRQLLRLNVDPGHRQEGRGARATRSAARPAPPKRSARGGYRQKALISSFVGMFPMSDPKFLVLVSLDEPKGIAETGGYATGGMVSAPSVKAIIENIVVALRHPAGRLEQDQTPLEIASTPMPCRQLPRRRRSCRRRAPSAGSRSARRCRRAPADRRRPHRRECAALLLSELMRRAPTLRAPAPRTIRLLPA